MGGGGRDLVPAWMVCVDILNKAKRELVTQAVETLEREVKAGRLDIKGSMITVPDQPSDDEMKLFVIGQVLSNAEQMRERYGSYIRGIYAKGKGATPQEVEGAERASLLLMAVEKIEMLVGYGRQLDSWINDASMAVSIDDPALVLKETSGGSGRKELLAFIRGNRVMLSEGTFSAEERGILDGASA